MPLADGRQMRVAEYIDGRRVLARLLQVPQLGHAWSGGDPAYPFAAASPWAYRLASVWRPAM